jgi:outer membrane lipoprotein-sorting protein
VSALRVLTLCLLLAIAAAAPLRAADPTDAVLARLASAAAGIETAQGRVRQEKRLEMFKDTVVSKGRFAYRRPDQLRWELTEPVASGFAITGPTGRRWHGLTGRTEPFALESDPMMRVVASQILASIRADFAPLRKEYRISVAAESPVTLVLEPLVANPFVERVTVAFAKGDAHVASVTVREKGGDSTTFSFTDVEVNQPIPDGTF